METVTLYIGVQSSDATESMLINESGKKPLRDDDNSSFLCPRDHVLIGRWHKGDENGGTRYKHGKLSIVNGNDYEVVLSDVMYGDYMKESDSKYYCPPSCMLVGREHTGDENGQTRYAYKKVYVQKKSGIIGKDNPLLEIAFVDGEAYKKQDRVTESEGKWTEFLLEIKNTLPEQTYYAPMYGREHDGDENGLTKTAFALFGVKIEE